MEDPMNNNAFPEEDSTLNSTFTTVRNDGNDVQTLAKSFLMYKVGEYWIFFEEKD